MPPTTSTASPVERDTQFERATALLAHLSVVVVGVDFSLRPGLSATMLAAVLLLPLWLGSVRRYRFGTTIVLATVVAVASGLVLSELASIDHSISRSNQVQSVGLLVSGIAAVGLLLWAREHVPLHRVVALYGLGALIGAVSMGELSWKFDLAVPATFLALGLLGENPRHSSSAAVVLGLGTLGVLDEGRSLFALCLLTAVLTMWYAPRRQDAPARRTWVPLAMLAAASLVIYFLATALLTGGYLGATLEERSNTQIATTGSLIAGGRPEWAATRELMSIRPEGYGVGVVPSWSDYMAGTSGLSSINVDTGGYAKYYLFGGQFRLHSVAADLWVSYGFAGIALAITIAAALLRSLGGSLAARRPRAPVIFACLLALWYLLFGPIYSNWLDVCVAVGLAASARDDQLGP